jgi:hypothetical protein
LWYSWLPWLKLKRATFMPARSSSSITSTAREAGPSVQTTLVLHTLLGVPAGIAGAIAEYYDKLQG